MAITQIPFQDPIAPEKPQPEQLGLYDGQDWETAYRDLDAHVPHLLIQLQDDLQRSRKREAAWISIIVHLLVFMILVYLPWIEKNVWHRGVVVAVDQTKGKNLTFLTLPPDAQKLTHKPNTNIVSDKDRIAMTRHPELDPKELRKILAPQPPGAPGMTGPRAPQAAPQALSQNQAQNQPAGQQQEQAPQTQRPQFETNQTAQLQAPTRPNNSFSKYGAMTPGQAIQAATQGAAINRAGGGGQGGDFGLNTGAHGRVAGGLDVMSDTLGVDFAPYLERVRAEVLTHWYEVLPPSFYPPISKKGKLLIQFSILPDGRVTDMHLVASSDDTSLDRAAWGGITGSSPFPPLPEEYLKLGGHELTIRGLFLYNMDEKDFK